MIRAAAILGFFGVFLGAFGAHALRGRVPPDMLEVWRTAVLYHLLHAVALLAVGLGAARIGRARVVGGLFIAGVLVFSGSLYAMVATGVRALGAVTPLGGGAFMAGWITLAVTVRPSSYMENSRNDKETT